MPIHRAHVLLPEDLLRDIDQIVGPGGRSAFLVETARAEVRRQKQLQFLESKDPAWRAENHPELWKGAAAAVRRMRRESETRLRGAPGTKRKSNRAKPT